MDATIRERASRRSLVSAVTFTALMLSAVLLGPAGTSASAGGAFDFEPLAVSSNCTAGGTVSPPIDLPTGYAAEVLATEDGTTFLDWADMHSLNETGAQAGRYLFHTHEYRYNAGLTVTDLWDGTTRVVDRRQHWERLDGLRWTPWGTLLFAEEIRTNHNRPAGTPPAADLLEPTFQTAVAGLVYEANVDDLDDPQVVVREQIGSRAHEGLAFDRSGNLYGIHEASTGSGQNGGAIYRFVPDRWGDLSSGKLYALKVDDTATKTGTAHWVELNQAQSVIDSNVAADQVGATKYLQPEDLEVWADTLFVTISDEHRVLAIDLRLRREQEPDGTGWVDVTQVWDYVKAGANGVPASTRIGQNAFTSPDNLAFDPQGYLYISEDAGPNGRSYGNDVWVAAPALGDGPPIALPGPVPSGLPESSRAPLGEPGPPSPSVVRFASLTDCLAEPSGPYFAPGGNALYIHIMHRGVNGPAGTNQTDASLRITGT